ncbi:MAG: hypothetical protein ABI528_04070 [bacterium]
MNKSKKETGNTETKDYEAKADGKFPDDSLYPESEQSKPVTKKKKSDSVESGNGIIPKVKGKKTNKSDQIPDYEPVKQKFR